VKAASRERGGARGRRLGEAGVGGSGAQAREADPGVLSSAVCKGVLQSERGGGQRDRALRRGAGTRVTTESKRSGGGNESRVEWMATIATAGGVRSLIVSTFVPGSYFKITFKHNNGGKGRRTCAAAMAAAAWSTRRRRKQRYWAGARRVESGPSTRRSPTTKSSGSASASASGYKTQRFVKWVCPIH
jgi:hypothetical protein